MFKFFLNTLILLELRKECVKIAISFYIKGLAQPIPKKLGNRMKKLEHRVKDSQIDEIKELINEYIINPKNRIYNIWISVLIKDFVKNSITELRNTSLEKLLINPFLVKAFGFDDHKEVVSFYFYQKITRSVVTSWGFTVEGLLLCSGPQKTDMAGFDMKVERQKKTYQFQIKSSPNTIDIIGNKGYLLCQPSRK